MGVSAMRAAEMDEMDEMDGMDEMDEMDEMDGMDGMDEMESSTRGMRSSTLGDRRLVARAGLALVVANVRYWSTVAPVVRGQLRRWESRARAIEDPELRALALAKLRGEGFHAQAAAMCATLAPRAHRRDAVEAIVALELLYDYLDGLTERPSADPLGEGGQLFGAYVDAVTIDRQRNGTSPDPRRDEPAHRDGPPAGDRDGPRSQDGGYLQALSDAVRVALDRLPAAGAIAQVAPAGAARGGQAQTRMHAASQLGTAQLEDWARSEARGTGLQWRELLAGAASSVLALHALIAAAANPGTTREEAARIEFAYLSTCNLLTLLDGLVDHDRDTRTGGSEDGSPAGGLSAGGKPGGKGGLGEQSRLDAGAKPGGKDRLGEQSELDGGSKSGGKDRLGEQSELDGGSKSGGKDRLGERSELNTGSKPGGKDRLGERSELNTGSKPGGKSGLDERSELDTGSKSGETDGPGGSAGLGGTDRLGYIGLYEDREELSQTLIDAAKRAARQARGLRDGPHHAMTLVGVVAYYTSDPGARGELAAPIVERLRHELAPLIYPTLVVMRAWRLAKRLRAGRYRRSSSIGELASSIGKTSQQARWGGYDEI
jgi:tetraprenyl-beta-curcumene synthase